MQGIRWRDAWDEYDQSLFTKVCSVVSLGLCLHGSIIVKVTAWEWFEGCRNPIGGPEIEVPTQKRPKATRTSHASLSIVRMMSRPYW